MRTIVTTVAALFVVSGAFAQNGVERVLRSVEENSVTLRARRELTGAQVLEARSSNNLGNPTVSYDQLWGTPSEVGRSGEINVAQPFDFPTVYANRSKMNRLLERQYGHEYAVFRRQVLLQAQEACIAIVAQRRLKALADEKVKNAERLAALYAVRSETGDANILEQNKVNLELVAARNAARLVDMDLAALESQLVNLNGGVPVDFPDTEYPPLSVLQPLDSMLVFYRENDPQLLAFRTGVEAAEQDVKLSKAQSLPSFEVGYRREFAAGEHSDGFTVGMSVPLFESRGRVKRARAQAQFARTQLESGRIDVETNLRQLYNKAAQLEHSLREYGNALAPDRNLELLDKALRVGQVSVVDYFTELSTVYQVREALITTERDYRVVRARIEMIGL